jgi:predicted ATPase/DNA-binding SARP family transcriptional activator
LQQGDTAVTGLASRKAAALLIYLACNPGSHPRETLATLLWDDRTSQQALANLSVLLSSLRKQVGDYLAITPQTIGMAPEREFWLDAAEFAARAAMIPAGNAPLTRTTAAQLTQAVELYRGDFLAGFYLRDASGFEEWALLERERLQLLAQDALQRLAAFHAARGHYAAGIPYVLQLTRLDPLREAGQRQLMRLLALDGQRNAALAQYATCMQALEEELGVDPDPETTQLYEQIRAGALEVKPVQTAAAPQPDGRRPNLPAQPTPFVGRAAELAIIAERLDNPACRLLTIVGPGGAGKTRLALRAAAAKTAEFLHGVHFIPLAALETADLLPAAIADVLEFTFARGAAPAAQLVEYLRRKEMLLVLDNFERLLDGAPLLTAILDQAPEVKLLVTSQERLRLQHEWLLSLSGLPLSEPAAVGAGSEAIDLFVSCVQRLQPGYQLAEGDRAGVARICRLVGGSPLGIELAAAWTRLLSCTEIAAEIERSYHFLQAPLRDRPKRHRSLEAVFIHAWELLTDAERHALARLAVFRGGFERSAAAEAADADLATLAGLVDKSFLQVTAPRDGAAGQRYELHETLREFAAARLTEQPHVAAATRQRHGLYFGRFLQAQRPLLRGGQQLAALAAVRAEIRNVRAALRWLWEQDEPETAVFTTAGPALDALFHFYTMRSWFQEGAAVFRAAAEWLRRLAPHGAAALLGQALARQGWMTFLLGQRAAARPLLEAGLAHARAAGTPADAAFCLNYLGALAHYQGDQGQAQAYLAQSLDLCRAAGDRYAEAIARNIMGVVSLAQADYAAARAWLAQSLALKQTLGDQWGMAFSLANLGAAAAATGDAAAARDLVQQSLEIRRAIGDRRGEALCLRDLAHLAEAARDMAEAQRLHAAHAAIMEEIGI